MDFWGLNLLLTCFESLTWIISEGPWVSWHSPPWPGAAPVSVSWDSGRPALPAPSPPPSFSVGPWTACLWRPRCDPGVSAAAVSRNPSRCRRRSRKDTVNVLIMQEHWISLRWAASYLRFDLSFFGFGAQRRRGQYDFTKGNIICDTDGVRYVFEPIMAAPSDLCWNKERNLQRTHKHLFFHPGLLSVQLFLLQPLQLKWVVPAERREEKKKRIDAWVWLLFIKAADPNTHSFFFSDLLLLPGFCWPPVSCSGFLSTWFLVRNRTCLVSFSIRLT